MSEFYGRMRGHRGESTRCGSKSSGIVASVETWSSVVRTRFQPDHTAWLALEDKAGNPCGLKFSFEADTLSECNETERLALRAISEALEADLESVVRAIRARRGLPEAGDMSAADGLGGDPVR